jgi:hypothetical protein
MSVVKQNPLIESTDLLIQSVLTISLISYLSNFSFQNSIRAAQLYSIAPFFFFFCKINNSLKCSSCLGINQLLLVFIALVSWAA